MTTRILPCENYKTDEQLYAVLMSRNDDELKNLFKIYGGAFSTK